MSASEYHSFMMNAVQQLRGVDLNLLVVLDILLREQSVTRAAGRLQRTPSAVSHSLRRLRVLFGDELLLRDGQRMRLTARAEVLAETLPRALGHLARVLAEPEAFDASTATRTFRLAAPEFVAPLVPLLLSELAVDAPGVRVAFASLAPGVDRLVAEGRIDGLIAPSALGTDSLRGMPLGSWSWRVYGRPDHPAFADWSLDAWVAYPHVRVSTSLVPGDGPIDRLAAQLGVERTIGATIPHFSMAASVLTRTDMLFTAPSIAMDRAARAHGLEHRQTPFVLPPMGLSLFRSAAMGNEPGVLWFLTRVAAVAGQLEELP